MGRWVTLDDDQHVYITDRGETLATRKEIGTGKPNRKSKIRQAIESGKAKKLVEDLRAKRAAGGQGKDIVDRLEKARSIKAGRDVGTAILKNTDYHGHGTQAMNAKREASYSPEFKRGGQWAMDRHQRVQRLESEAKKAAETAATNQKINSRGVKNASAFQAELNRQRQLPKKAEIAATERFSRGGYAMAPGRGTQERLAKAKEIAAKRAGASAKPAPTAASGRAATLAKPTPPANVKAQGRGTPERVVKPKQDISAHQKRAAELVNLYEKQAGGSVSNRVGIVKGLQEGEYPIARRLAAKAIAKAHPELREAMSKGRVYEGRPESQRKIPENTRAAELVAKLRASKSTSSSPIPSLREQAAKAREAKGTTEERAKTVAYRAERLAQSRADIYAQASIRADKLKSTASKPVLKDATKEADSAKLVAIMARRRANRLSKLVSDKPRPR